MTLFSVSSIGLGSPVIGWVADHAHPRVGLPAAIVVAAVCCVTRG
jgi:hypothetical protein